MKKAIVIGIILAIVVIAFFRYRHEEAMRRNALDKIGNIQLDPGSLNFGKLKAIMATEGKISPHLHYDNAVEVSFHGDAVVATFLGYVAYPPPDSREPIEISISDYFPGTLRGIHIGDSSQSTVADFKQRGCAIESSFEESFFQVNCSKAGSWEQTKPLIRAKWEKLKDHDLASADEVIAGLQESYGLKQDEAIREFDAFMTFDPLKIGEGSYWRLSWSSAYGKIIKVSLKDSSYTTRPTIIPYK